MTVMDLSERRDLKRIANAYCDNLAWPTVVLVMVTSTLFFTVPALVFRGDMPLWMGVIGMALVLYANYTGLHEAVHGAVCGAKKQYRWVNELVGHLAGVIMGIPLAAHRHEHFLHHNHTNSQDKDPDIFCARMMDSPWQAVAAAYRLTAINYRVFWRDAWSVIPAKQRVVFIVELAAIILSRVVVLAMPFGLVGEVASSNPWWIASAMLLLLFIGPLLGTVLLIYLFAYLVHVPHDVQRTFADTSVYEPPPMVRSVMTWMWGFQNYHGIHHAFPRVPWYRYRALFEDQKEAILRQGIPTYHLSGAGWRRIN